VKHMSVWLDVRIVLLTIKTVLFGRETGAPAEARPAPAAPPAPSRAEVAARRVTPLPVAPNLVRS
jgi:hypothetical protein